MNIKRIGLDLAKQVFQLHGVDRQEQPVLRKKIKREQVLPYFRDLPLCLIGMEACSSAHYWARELQKLGHTVKLIAPQFVKPYVKANKNDAHDAAAICEAVSRPSMTNTPLMWQSNKVAGRMWNSPLNYPENPTKKPSGCSLIPNPVGNLSSPISRLGRRQHHSN
jgi:transposase